MKLLIAYATTEGHTRLIAERVGVWVRADGHEADVIDTAAVPEGLDVAGYDGFVLLGSLHMGRHQASLTHFVNQNLWEIREKPSAFVSASLTAAGHEPEDWQEALDCIDKFTESTGWTPKMWTPVAGALLYVEYDWLRRMLLRMISKRKGGPIDTTRDYEFTDWAALRAFVNEFVALVRAPAEATA